MAAARNLNATPIAFVAASAFVLASCGDPPPHAAPKPAEPRAPAPVPAKPDPAKPTPAPANTPTAPEAPKASDPMTTPANPTLPIEKVTIAGKVFKLELASTNETRFHGLSGRTALPGDGGMLFVFPARWVQRHGFVMRDCPVAIDIIYLDVSGRIVGMHKMVPEPPRSEAEKVLDPGTGVNDAYEGRLKKYFSTYPAQFVIELAGNTLDSMKLKEGEKIDLELDRLKKLAK
jgi:uncharacterized membrane protein (UPF0127 family)